MLGAAVFGILAGAGAASARPLAAVLAAGGVAAFGGGLALGTARALPWGLALLGASYAVPVALRPAGVDLLAPAFGAWLLLVAELGYWALELRAPARRDGAVQRRLAVRTGALGLAALLLDACCLAGAAGGRVLGGGLAVSLLGMAGAAGTLGLAAALAWRRARRWRAVPSARA